MDFPNGIYVRASIFTNDLSTAQALVWKDLDENTYTLQQNDRVLISHITMNNGDTAAVLTLFDDRDNSGTVNAGETLFRRSAGNASGSSVVFDDSPIVTTKRPATAANREIKVLASAAAANTSIVIIGQILKM